MPSRQKAYVDEPGAEAGGAAACVDTMSSFLPRSALVVTLASVWTFLASPAFSEPVMPVLVRPALATPQASHSVLIDIARAGTRLVAVGERGIVITSDDNGQSWCQSSVPVSVTLTAVQFVDSKNGWAVGHSGVVLRSQDGGASWTKQLDGVRAASLIVEDAKHAIASNPGSSAQATLKAAQQFLSDGPDKPFLYVHFDDVLHGYVVGAYGLIFHTADGGESWQSWLRFVDNPKGLNLYSIQSDGNTLYLAGEQGYFARSGDGGKSFKHIPTPRDASYFAMQVMPGGGVVVAGLRGSAFESTDRGDAWQPTTFESSESFSALVRMRDGRLLFANEAGEFFVQPSLNHPVESLGVASSHSVNAAVEAANGSLVTVGFRGVRVVGRNTIASTIPQGAVK
ncbi:glycosyl hydrolase BNR repeat-containing glycosyl hydrolase [Caballeronia udeis]|uniref:Glycosyl hydrolase BNR repeat-containing glycosyl hydrolase n=2 Tax=Caballeronia udeis TaxID=1232866 RepID=A0A158I5C4_9BURK|nr:glycosyl hydrolase BNR repeat-containing glycosyl hydrolase [Caballeronia udeis]